MGFALVEKLRGEGKRGEWPGELLLSEIVVGELSPTGELMPLQLKNEVSLFDADDMLGLGAGRDSLEPVVRWAFDCGSAYVCERASPLGIRECFIVVLWSSRPTITLELDIFSLRFGSLPILACAATNGGRELWSRFCKTCRAWSAERSEKGVRPGLCGILGEWPRGNLVMDWRLASEQSWYK